MTQYRFKALFVISVLLLWTLPGAINAQIRIDTWTTDNGLPQNSITGLTQTPDGYIPNSFGGRLTTFFVVIISAAIALLGPGTYSLDARLFGRREIIIPRPSRSQSD